MAAAPLWTTPQTSHSQTGCRRLSSLTESSLANGNALHSGIIHLWGVANSAAPAGQATADSSVVVPAWCSTRRGGENSGPRASEAWLSTGSSSRSPATLAAMTLTPCSPASRKSRSAGSRTDRLEAVAALAMMPASISMNWKPEHVKGRGYRVRRHRSGTSRRRRRARRARRGLRGRSPRGWRGLSG